MFCPSDIRSIPFFSHLYIYGALWGPSVLPAEPFCRQNDRTVRPAKRQNRSAGRTTEPFCRQNERTVLPAERQNRSAGRTTEPFCPSDIRSIPFLAIYIYTVHFGAHQFCRQNGRT